MKTLIIFFSVFLISGNLLAAGIRFTENKDWKTLLSIAKKENKLIFLDAYATWCGPCKYLQNSVFTNESVGSYFNGAFINAKIDMEEGEGPELSKQFGVTAYPTLFFINGDGKVVHKYVGALDTDALVDLGKEAIDPAKQYYTVKSKAEAGTLSPLEFHNWLHDAEKAEDEDADGIIDSYIASGTYPMLEKQMLKIIFEHGAELTETQLSQLVAGKQKVMEIAEITSDQFDEAITTKAVKLALAQSMKNEVIDFALFSQVVARYSTGQAALETQKMKIKYYSYKEDDKSTIDELAVLVSDPKLHVPALTLASQIAKYGDKIVSEKRTTEFISAVQRFKLLPEESGQGYYKDFSLLLIYSFMEDKVKIASLKEKIMTNKDTPEEVKALVAKLDEEG